MIFLYNSEKSCYRRIGYNLNVMRQSACLVFNPIMVDKGVRLYDCPNIKLFILVGWDRSFLSAAWPTGVQLGLFSFAPELVSYWAPKDLHRRAAYSICESLFLIHNGFDHDLFVCP